MVFAGGLPGLVDSAGGCAAVGSESGCQVLQRPPGVVGRGGWATTSPSAPGRRCIFMLPHGDYDTGVFAYYIIRRGERCGLRIVGSPLQLSLNVLAIYEKWAPSHTYVAYASATKEGRHANRLMPPLPAGSAVRPCRSGRVFWARWAEWVPSGRSGRGFGERGEAVQ